MATTTGGNLYPFFRGYWAANGLQVKSVASKSGLDPNVFSRKINKGEGMSLEEAFLVGVATGEARAETRQPRK